MILKNIDMSPYFTDFVFDGRKQILLGTTFLTKSFLSFFNMLNAQKLIN